MSERPDDAAVSLSPADARQRLLELRLRQRRPAAAGGAIVRRSEAADIPLSFAQEGLWFLGRLKGPSDVYNVARALRLDGALDIAALEKSLQALVARHESLRSAFALRGDAVVQLVRPAEEVLAGMRLEPEQAPGETLAEREQAAREWLRSASAEPFDLSRAPLLRARLLRLSRTEHVLLLVVHHIVLDGWSMGVLMRELGALYASSGDASGLPRLPIQFPDYALWQRERLGDQTLHKLLTYWREQLAGLETLELPTDRPRPARMTDRGGSARFEVSAPLLTQLKALARREDATLFMLLLAAFQVLLMRYARQQNLAVGVPVAGRNRPELEGLIGYFVNTLVLRTDLSGDPPFTALLRRVRQTSLDAYAHQEMPFDRLVAELSPERDADRNPLYQVAFSLQNQPPAVLELRGLCTRVVEPQIATAKFDLSLSCTEVDAVLHGVFDYRTDLFDAATVERLAAHLQNLLADIAAHPTRTVGELALLGEDERQRMLVHRNDTTTADRPDGCLHRLFEAQVRRSPDALAAESGAERVSYRDLDARANRLAHQLRESGVGADVVVGVCAERSLSMLVGLLGILKAGGAYLPLDPQYPLERLAFMLRDCAAPIVLAQRSLRDRIPDTGARIIELEPQGSTRAAASEPMPPSVTRPEHLAYVIYTSGSTGEPKGVQITHRGICNHLRWFAGALQVTASDRFLQKTSVSFDASVVELFAPLIAGASVVLAQGNGERDTGYLARAIREHGITILQMVPSALRALLSETSIERCASLRSLVCGGEALDRDLAREVRRRLSHVSLGNFYGPTEASIDATWHDVSDVPDGAGTVPIGRPIANVRCHVLDRYLEPVPLGVGGELFIGGAGLARGYLNRPELNAERFIADPFRAGERLYRSGDLARYLADGTIEYLGRVDDQIKLRGFRIELGEIEATLNACPGVRQGAVLLREDKPGLQQLVAYVAGEADIDALRDALRLRLPEHMVPSAFVSLSALPLLPSGKLDRKALPGAHASAPSRGGYEVPMPGNEQTLAALWQDLLGLEQVGRDDHFFELGGHSLLVVMLLERMRLAGFASDVGTIFANPTLSALAATLADGEPSAPAFAVPPNLIAPGCTAIDPSMLPLVELSQQEIDRVVAGVPGGAGNVQDILPLVPLQEGMLFQHLLETEGDPYLGRWLLEFDGRAELERFLRAVQAVIDRHDVLRTALMWQELSQPVQLVLRRAALPIHDVAQPGQGDTAEYLREITDPRHLRLNLSQAPLLAGYIAQDGTSGRWLLALIVHHAVIDHVSEEILQDEVAALLQGQSDTLTTPPPYRDFVAQSRRVAPAEHEAYFRALLADVDEPALPFGLADVRGAAFRNKKARLPLDTALAQRIRAAALRCGVSPAVLFHVAWALVVARCSGRDDVVFGTVLSGRSQGLAGGNSVMGLFINTLPVRISLGAGGVLDAVKQTHGQLSELMGHEQASLALAQRCGGVPAALPLFSALLNYRRGQLGSLDSRDSDAVGAFAGVRLLPIAGTVHYPFGAAVDDLDLDFVLTTHCDVATGPQRIAQYLRTAIEGVVDALDADPATAVGSIEVLPAAERQRLLRDFNDTAAARPREYLIHRLLERRPDGDPDALAVVTRDERLSYRELHRRATRLAHYLRSRGAGRGTLIGLCVERGAQMLVALLAVLETGAAYVPLDPAYPADRLHTMADDSQLALLVTESSLVHALDWPRERSVLLDIDAPRIEAQPDSALPADAALDAGPEDPAYVIYTSGSTGRPKGVRVPHRAVVNLLASMAREPGLVASDRLLAVTTLGFDIAVLELLLPLTVGAQVILASRDDAMDAGALLQLLQTSGANVMQATPATWRMLIDSGWNGSPAFKALVGGEALPADLAAQLLARTGELWNMYGPTETTVWSTCWKVRDTERGISIGRPIANTEVHVLDARARPCPIGVAGEIHIGGDGVALGYWNRPQLTGERFIADPFQSKGTLYRTGDRGRWRNDGLLEHLGRLDFQVKLRGHRIELGEIETHLASHPGVSRAVAVVREDRPGDMRLVAYVVPLAAMPEAGVLREHLRTSLPEYMLPQHYVQLVAIPLLPNGKTDRNGLPVPSTDSSPSAGPAFAAPGTEAEIAIADVWKAMLGIEHVGVTDNFFDLGGHSLLAMRAIVDIEKRLALRLSLRRLIFETLEQIASTATALAQVPSAPARREGWLKRLIGARRS